VYAPDARVQIAKGRAGWCGLFSISHRKFSAFSSGQIQEKVHAGTGCIQPQNRIRVFPAIYC
jgi:hypothetical protein